RTAVELRDALAAERQPNVADETIVLRERDEQMILAAFQRAGWREEANPPVTFEDDLGHRQLAAELDVLAGDNLSAYIHNGDGCHDLRAGREVGDDLFEALVRGRVGLQQLLQGRVRDD